jgi:predicted nucleic acid-binding protein
MILDSTFLIDVLRKRDPAPQLLMDLEKEGISTTAVSAMELWQHAGQQRAVQELLQSIVVLPFDEKAAKIAGELRQHMAAKGASIATQDGMIAAICLSTGETLVTRDADFAKIPGLRVLKY